MKKPANFGLTGVDVSGLFDRSGQSLAATVQVSKNDSVELRLKLGEGRLGSVEYSITRRLNVPAEMVVKALSAEPHIGSANDHSGRPMEGPRLTIADNSLGENLLFSVAPDGGGATLTVKGTFRTGADPAVPLAAWGVLGDVTLRARRMSRPSLS